MISIPEKVAGIVEAAHGAGRYRVLLIDPQVRSATEKIGEILARQQDIELIYCNKPAIALGLAGQEQPTVILIRLTQPLRSSLALIATIRASSECGNIPIIALSPDSHAATRRAAFSAGASDCLAEIPDELELLTRVRFCSDTCLAKRELELANRERAQTRSHLLQSEKMVSMGLLAAGVAHEINNPIAFVSSNLNSLNRYYRDIVGALDRHKAALDEQPAGQRECGSVAVLQEALNFDDMQEDVGQILDECRDGLSRVRKIVSNLKSYSRANESDWQRANLHEELDRALSLCNNELKYKAEVTKYYGDLPMVECLPTQINQVFLNLFVNAAQAIDDYGTITVATSCAVPPPNCAPDSAREGDWVCIKVSDNGVGIEPNKLSRIFEPFFTTKEVGKGTGLGLAVSSGIIDTHNGFIDVESEPGQGTTFSIWLPVSQNADRPGVTANLETKQP